LKKLKIDNEFKNLIPPLTKKEYKQLEENLIEEGCRDSLVVWNDTIVDGHNRYDICTNTKHIIPFSIKEMDFESRDEAKEWIIRNQFGRRNLPAYERAKLALKLKPYIEEKAKENQGKRNDLTSVRNLTNVDTKKELAKIAGVSHDTIHKVEVIENEGTDEIKHQLKNKEISINKAYSQIKDKNETRLCSLCGKEKPISEFYGSQGECKDCNKSRKHIGISVKEAAELNQKFPDEILNELYVEMKTPHSPKEVNGENNNNLIIAEFEKILNNFNSDINKFTFMEQYFKSANSIKPLIESSIKNLQKIINFIKE
jgi:DNA-binding XRE family transcriptional regulator